MLAFVSLMVTGKNVLSHLSCIYAGFSWCWSGLRSCCAHSPSTFFLRAGVQPMELRPHLFVAWPAALVDSSHTVTTIQLTSWSPFQGCEHQPSGWNTCSLFVPDVGQLSLPPRHPAPNYTLSCVCSFLLPLALPVNSHGAIFRSGLE